MGHPARLLPQVLDSSLDAQVCYKFLFIVCIHFAILHALIRLIREHLSFHQNCSLIYHAASSLSSFSENILNLNLFLHVI